MESLFEGGVNVVPNGELRVVEGGHDENVLAKFVRDKICGPNRDLFTGHMNAVTGELLIGKRIYILTQECYDGPFVRGERHGLGVCTKLNGEGKFLGTFSNGAYHRGTLVTKDHTYVGLFFEGIFHGTGTLMHSNGTLYEGNFEKGMFHGQGKLTSISGDRYEGGFRDGKKQGHGTMKYNHGGVYVGDWNMDRKDGVGKERLNSRHVYEGEYVNDERHGKGTLKTPSATLTGPWRNDKPLDGQGWTVVYPKSEVEYTGNTLSFRPHGYGRFCYQGTESDMTFVYEGNVLCGLRHGDGQMVAGKDKEVVRWKGDIPMPSEEAHLNAIEEIAGEEEEPESSFLVPSLEEIQSSCSESSRPESEEGDEDSDIKVFPNGDIFRGHIDVFGKWQGFGIFTEFSTSMTFSGQWKSSRKHGRGTLDQPSSGIQYVGSFIEDVMEGQGSLRLQDGSKYCGEFVRGMMYGRGTFHDNTNESVYTGEFVKSVKHGYGEEEYTDNTIYCGSFVNGKRSGEKGSLYRASKDGRVLLYQGEWTNDRITGYGTYFEFDAPCAGSYAGGFRDETRHGHGIFTAKDGFIFEGEWSSDDPCDGDWVISCPRGSVYYGAAICKGGIPVADGFGTYNENEGTFYSGGFRLGQKHGSGLCVFSSGEQWDGRWEDGVFLKYGRSRP